ncbi:hypothetical protein FGE20_02125 [Elizabethkingia sp. JS20170427COW]|nr:hypothetical protein FGE20_02125 [Elizabethkingia sp. JS20170427COW]
MKKQLIIYGIIITLYFIYNQFFALEDAALNDLINIIFSSFIFLYMAYIAYCILQKMKNKK